MLDLFKKKKPQIPELSDEIIIVRDASISEVRRQAGIFFGDDSITRLPDMSQYHDLNAAAYASGFISGMLQVGGEDVKLAKGDHALAHAIWASICIAAFVHLYDETRANSVIDAFTTQDTRSILSWQQMDQYGGTDGIAHAQGEEKQKGGLLLHYLRHNYETGA